MMKLITAGHQEKALFNLIGRGNHPGMNTYYVMLQFPDCYFLYDGKLLSCIRLK
jgi:hypothetical protein